MALSLPTIGQASDQADRQIGLVHPGLNCFYGVVNATILDGHGFGVEDEVAGAGIPIAGLADTARIDNQSVIAQQHGAGIIDFQEFASVRIMFSLPVAENSRSMGVSNETEMCAEMGEIWLGDRGV